LTRILNDLAAGKTPKPGPQIDRQNSAPIGGPDTLIDPSIYEIATPSADAQEAPMPKPPISDSTGQQRN